LSIKMTGKFSAPETWRLFVYMINFGLSKYVLTFFLI
jgi:hypothetical protein